MGYIISYGRGLLDTRRWVVSIEGGEMKELPEEVEKLIIDDLERKCRIETLPWQHYLWKRLSCIEEKIDKLMKMEDK
jgi:hypothetical protein